MDQFFFRKNDSFSGLTVRSAGFPIAFGVWAMILSTMPRKSTQSRNTICFLSSSAWYTGNSILERRTNRRTFFHLNIIPNPTATPVFLTRKMCPEEKVVLLPALGCCSFGTTGTILLVHQKDFIFNIISISTAICWE